VRDLQLRDRLILVLGNCHELRLTQNKRIYRFALLHYMQTRHILVHRIQNNQAIPVRWVIGQLELLERDNLLHPVGTTHRRVLMQISPEKKQKTVKYMKPPIK